MCSRLCKENFSRRSIVSNDEDVRAIQQKAGKHKHRDEHESLPILSSEMLQSLLVCRYKFLHLEQLEFDCFADIIVVVLVSDLQLEFENACK